jgi:hypothetical protein
MLQNLAKFAPGRKTVPGLLHGGVDEGEGEEPAGLKTRHVGEFGKGWQRPKVCWALVPKLEATVRQKNGRIDKVWQVKQKINCRLGCDTHKNIRTIGLKTAQENNDKYEQHQTQSTAEGRHWSFPG